MDDKALMEGMKDHLQRCNLIVYENFDGSFRVIPRGLERSITRMSWVHICIVDDKVRIHNPDHQIIVPLQDPDSLDHIIAYVNILAEQLVAKQNI